MADVSIGTSGWTYDGWRGPFYPDDVPKKRWLNWYSQRFSSTEINGSFYRTPSLEAVRAWREETPKNFLLAWKARRNHLLLDLFCVASVYSCSTNSWRM